MELTANNSKRTIRGTPLGAVFVCAGSHRAREKLFRVIGRDAFCHYLSLSRPEKTVTHAYLITKEEWAKVQSAKVKGVHKPREQRIKEWNLCWSSK